MVNACIVAFLVNGGGCEKNITDKDISITSYVEVQRLLDESSAKQLPDLVLLMDPRTPTEYFRAHLPGAKNVQLDEIQSNLRESRQGRIAQYNKFENIVVYGNDPASTVARAMVKRLLANDYGSVYWFQGGLREWIAAGGKLEGSSANAAAVSK